MTPVENDSSALFLEFPDTMAIPEIDAAICAALGVRFFFLTSAEKLVPRNYHPRTPSVDPQSSLVRERCCQVEDHPDCENCEQWHRCAELQVAISVL
ncbi:MAG: hypothetical protein HY912_16085 [Desulfomonile tiedjei]|uniref:Uncharacterized protein n=1 Tax=Desulfomonile tiedjei TaxID=2358 RepID=A0A9D6Z4I0_9BACT|nr:hypothetical protein [Desulfomonile tiedjei]